MNSPSTQLRASVLDGRRQLAEGREAIFLLHQRGLTGRNVCARFTTIVDTIVTRLYEKTLASLPDSASETARKNVTLVAVGGYGRRQLAPFSDVDLMILYRGRTCDALVEIARRMTQDVFDVGLVLGHSVRTAAQAVRLARSDAQIATSLIEARPLMGAQDVFDDFARRFSQLSKRRQASLIGSAAAERNKERAQFGETVYLLEPNIKRSRGGLRDIHLLRWLGGFRYGTADPDRLRLAGALSKLDHHRISKAQEFLLRLRNEMHFHAKSARDTLDRGEQMRLAHVLDYRGTNSILPVEQLMRDYFWHTTQVWNLVRRFLDSTRPTPRTTRLVDPVLGYQVDDIFRIGRREISVTPAGLEILKGSLDQVLRLVELSSQYDRAIAPSTWSTVYLAAPKLPEELTVVAARHFLSLLGRTTRLGEALRGLHELGVLERIVPGFADVRCLLQFNQYHKFTVDEHCIRSVECATEFAERDDVLGEVYRVLADKTLLHCALLVHDLGKGQVEDHSEVGRRLAVETAERFQLSPDRTRTLEFLVHRHLLLSNSAFRRDTRDPATLARLAAEIGSPEVLEMLFVLSCADLAAVGPEVLTDWKIAVLDGLRRRTLAILTRQDENGVEEAEPFREEVRKILAARDNLDAWAKAQLDALPADYLGRRPAETTAESIDRWRSMSEGTAEACGAYRPDHKTVEFDATVNGGIGTQIFSMMAGTLAAKGFDIHSAAIDTLPAGHQLLRFVTTDEESPTDPDPARIDEVVDALVRSISRDGVPPVRQIWGEEVRQSTPATSIESRVEIDNSVSDRYSLIEMITFDRRGLLCEIASVLHDLGLIVYVAKIGTYVDQVVDVFYVTDRQGQKIVDSAELAEVRQRLLSMLE